MKVSMFTAALIGPTAAFAATGAPASTFGSGFELFAAAGVLGAVGAKKAAVLLKRKK